MKVLIATGIYPPDIGGPATYSKTLKDEFPKHNVDVAVLSFGEVRRLPKIIRHFIYFLKCLRQGGKADVIFAQDPVSVGLPAAFAAKILRKKFVLKIVGDYAWEQQQNQKLKRNKLFANESKKQKSVNLEEFQNGKFDFLTETRRKIQKWVAKKADKIIVPSEYLKKIVHEGWKINNNRIKVIYNCVESSGNNNREERNEMGKNYILSVGRLVPWKGFDVLIEIMADLPEEIRLIIAGSGPEMESLEIKISNLKLKNRIELTSAVSKEKIYEYLRKAGIFILNTSYEGLSHVILEAMVCGAPVITTNVGGNPELIKNGYNGILVEYNNKEQIKEATLSLWNNLDLQKKFADNSYEKLKNFSLEKMIEKTIKILNS